MVIVADDAPAAEACICKPCSAGHAQERIKFGSCKHNAALSLSVAQLVVELTISRRTNDTQYNTTLLPSVNTLIARGMFCGAKNTHHTFTPIIKHFITTANKHPGKKSFIDNNMRKSHWHQAVHIT